LKDEAHDKTWLMATDSHQHWNAKEYALHARFVADLACPLIGMLDPKPGETILDLGCGDGVLTAEIQRLGVRVMESTEPRP
jgi:2-polyprenyl-3-methyl-5-hydroxy-6-metoxy-1,4-benzoquinol methylase